jgi:hypothetical protein
VGLSTSFVRDVPLPFLVKGAVRFNDQAHFHVRKYRLPLAEEMLGNGRDDGWPGHDERGRQG